MKRYGQVSQEWLEQVVVLVRERTKTLLEMVNWITPYLGNEAVMDEDAVKKFLTPSIAPILDKLIHRFESLPAFSKAAWEEAFKNMTEEEGIKMGQLAQPVRVSLTGRTASPGLFEVMEVLGRERTLHRLHRDSNGQKALSRMFKRLRLTQRTCSAASEGDEAYFFAYVESLSAARTKLEDIFNILLGLTDLRPLL